MKLPWLLCLASCALSASEARQYTDPQTGLQAWEWTGLGLELHQIQRIPDQTRGFFLGRGFDRADTERIAAYCVFQTIFRNRSDRPVSVELADWRVDVAGELRPFRARAAWQATWEAQDSPQGARIAFEWSLFPESQTFAPGDWNMGMLIYPAAPGERVNLHFSWQAGRQPGEGVIEDLACARNATAEAASPITGDEE